MAPHPSPIRGKPVTIISGKYVKNNGAWINEAEGDKGFTDHMVYVLIQLSSGTMKCSRLQKESVINYQPRVPPTSYDEAVIDQHQELQIEMRALAKKIAMYHIRDAHVYGKAMVNMINEAQLAARDKNSRYRTLWMESGTANPTAAHTNTAAGSDMVAYGG